MNIQVRDKWLDALTSGDYAQAEGQLGIYRDGEPDAFCCLGVLCDVLLDDDMVPIELDKRMESDPDSISFNGETGLLPANVADWVGLQESPNYSFNVTGEYVCMGYQDDGSYSYPKPFDTRGGFVNLELANLNDEGFTFARIADVIRWANPS